MTTTQIQNAYDNGDISGSDILEMMGDPAELWALYDDGEISGSDLIELV